MMFMKITTIITLDRRVDSNFPWTYANFDCESWDLSVYSLLFPLISVFSQIEGTFIRWENNFLLLMHLCQFVLYMFFVHVK